MKLMITMVWNPYMKNIGNGNNGGKTMINKRNFNIIKEGICPNCRKSLRRIDRENIGCVKCAFMCNLGLWEQHFSTMEFVEKNKDKDEAE